MKKQDITIWVVLACTAGCCGCLPHPYQAIFGPGSTMEETARILVHDLEFGGRAKQKAIQYGDAILPLIEKKTAGFTGLNEGKNSGFVVDELKKVTGKSYGYDQAAWLAWWISVQGKWQIPATFMKPWDEQEKMY